MNSQAEGSLTIVTEIFPLVEALPGELGRGWTIQGGPSGTGSVDLENKQMIVPLGESTYDLNVRIHELAHAIYTRGQPGRHAARYGVDVLIYQAVEDHRIHYLITTRAGIDLSEGCLPPGDVVSSTKKILDAADYRELTLALVAAAHTGTEGVIREALASAVDCEIAPVLKVIALAEEAMRRLCRRPSPHQRRTGSVARWLQDQFDKQGWKPVEPEPGTSRESLLQKLIRRYTREPRSGFVLWGDMQIEQPPRARATTRKMGRTWRACAEGLTLRYPHRLLTDTRVFARACRVAGGATLIDVSGSMALNADHVWDVVTAAPGATVACYAGRGDSGTLRILARHGRLVRREDCEPDFGSMNVIDGPALRWLSRQPGPRIWVSDGLVTGVRDQTGTGNDHECRRICARAGIRRVGTVEGAVELLRSLHA